jgi:D-alanine-D-alanine ligase
VKIAFTHNLRLHDTEDEAEFDSVQTVDAIAAGLRAGGHEVEKIEVTGPASHLAARIESFGPDLIFNTAEGRRGRTREAFYPALFEELGFPYTGSDAYALTVTLDKWMTKLILSAQGIDTPRARLVVSEVEGRRQRELGMPGLAFPVIVKPNYEGSSKGIGDDAVARDTKALAEMLPRALRRYPAGVLVEEFIAGSDVTVPFVEGVADDGVLLPVDYVVEPGARSRYNIYDYRLKSTDSHKVSVRCPPDIPRDTAARLRAITRLAVRTLGLRDLGRVDFRIGEDGRIYVLEVNALPSLERGASIFAAAAREGLDYEAALGAIVNSAARRQGLSVPVGGKKKRAPEPLRIGFTYNMKRVGSKGNDVEAEYDAPETIDSIREALESYGHVVIPLEATPDLPRQFMDSPVDLVFNIAEGVAGRNREAAVPALCELMGIPYTGSDAATLSIALDKALSKRMLRQHGILTPEFQLMETGRERISPKLKFPVIVKPNQEGSSKGVSAHASVVDDEEGLRAVVRELLERYRQPALIEDYIAGREFTVGLLGDKRPRVLPPMEILFKDKDNPRPVYDYQIKQEWEKHVYYECPASLTPAELKAIERTARETFTALDCRDVARVDLRMDGAGDIYVLEVNPLPGLTPEYSDLCLIAKAANIDYRSLIGEILSGGLKRLREKRRAEAEEARAQRADDRQLDLPGAAGKDRDRDRDKTPAPVTITAT